MEQVSEWMGTMLKINIGTGKLELDRRKDVYWKSSASLQANKERF